MASVRRLVQPLLDLVFPRSCVACGDPVDDPVPSPLRFVCARCAGMLRPNRGPTCATCGHPLDPEAVAPPCPACSRLPPAEAPPWTAARSFFLHEGPARAMIVTLKFHRGTYLRGDFERLLGLFPDLPGWVGQSTLVPVPTTPARERARGVNQAELLAAAVASRCPRSRVRRALGRVLDTPTQTRLNRRLRSSNVSHAFQLLPPPASSWVRGESLVLVDDVTTTGATLASCARLLHRAGASEIRVLAWVHG